MSNGKTKRGGAWAMLGAMGVLAGCAASAPMRGGATTTVEPLPHAQAAPAVDAICPTAETCNADGAAALIVRDYGRATDLLQHACDLGSAAGCSNLGGMFRRGDGVAQDGDRAVALYDRACDGGDVESCDDVGLMLHQGDGVAMDDTRALAFFEKACKGKNADGCFNAGVLFAKGLGVTADQAHAAVLFESACDAGHPAGCSSAGLWFYKGSGSKKDYARAATFFRKACDKFDAEGCMNLGVATLKGHGVDANEGKALELFQRACERGSDEACKAAKDIQAGGVATGTMVSVGGVTSGGLDAREVSCRIKGSSTVTATDVVADLSVQRKALDECAPDGDAPKVSWTFAGGKAEGVKVNSARGAKVAACVERAVGNVRSVVEGSCSAVLLIGAKNGAEKAVAKRFKR